MDYAELSRRIEASTTLSPKRREHSRNVAALAAELCARADIDPERGRAAGLAHDMCKELPAAELAALAAGFPGAAPTSSLLGGKVVHGPAAAAVLARDFGVDDRELLDAVAFHTLGRVGMGRLETIVYCADKLEPGRRDLDPAFRERCLSLPPELMLPEVVARLVRWFEVKGFSAAPETLVLLKSLSRRVPTV